MVGTPYLPLYSPVPQSGYDIPATRGFTGMSFRSPVRAGIAGLATSDARRAAGTLTQENLKSAAAARNDFLNAEASQSRYQVGEQPTGYQDPAVATPMVGAARPAWLTPEAIAPREYRVGPGLFSRQRPMNARSAWLNG